MNRFRPLTRRAIIACAIGVASSLLLFAIFDYLSKRDYVTGWENALFWFIFVGLFAALGLDSRISAAVMISVNALIYSVIAFGILSLIHRVRKRLN
jgi:hypothetical protein